MDRAWQNEYNFMIFNYLCKNECPIFIFHWIGHADRLAACNTDLVEYSLINPFNRHPPVTL